MKRSMTRLAGLLFLVMVFVLTASLGLAKKDKEKDAKILEFDTMFGVSGALLGGNNPIRGISGGGLPWVLDSVEGELKENGKLEIEVEGLIIPAVAGVPPGIGGTNPVPAFKGAVSCLTMQSGQVMTVNVFTGEFPASPEGDAEIEAMLDLPDPCIAPIVFVTSPNNMWFAVTGN